MDVDGAIDEYLARRAALGGRWSPATARSTGYLLRSWARHMAGADWRTPDVDDVIGWACVPGSQDGRHRRLSCVKVFYGWCVAWGWLDRDPLGVWPQIAGAEGIPRPIPDRVFRRALAVAELPDYRALILGRFAGLRAGEIAAAHTEHLDGAWLWVRGKGGRERWVAAHPEVARVVERADGFVFPAAGGGHWRSGTITNRLAELLPSPWTAHSLRHAYATALYEDTRDLVVVAAQLGHRSTRTTERYVAGRHDRALEAVRGWPVFGRGSGWAA